MASAPQTPSVTPPQSPRQERLTGHGLTVGLANGAPPPQQILTKLMSTPPAPKPTDQKVQVLTPAQYNAQVAATISKNAEDARKKAVASGKTSVAAQKEMERKVEEAAQVSNTHFLNCQKLNEYKRLYYNDPSVPHKWRKSYDPEAVPASDAEAEVRAVELILDTRNGPAQLKAILPLISHGIEQALIKADLPQINPRGATEDLIILLEGNYMDQDIAEFVAKYAWFFRMPIEYRLSWGIGKVFMNRIKKNHPYFGKSFGTNIDSNIRQSTSDL